MFTVLKEKILIYCLVFALYKDSEFYYTGLAVVLLTWTQHSPLYKHRVQMNSNDRLGINIIIMNTDTKASFT